MGFPEDQDDWLWIAVSKRIARAGGEELDKTEIEEWRIAEHRPAPGRTLGAWTAPSAVAWLAFDSGARHLAVMVTGARGIVLGVSPGGDLGSPRELELPREWTNTSRGSANVSCLVFQPQTARLAAGPGVADIHVWDAASGAHLASLAGHSLQVTSLSFDPTGTRLLSTSYDTTARLWDVAGSLRAGRGVCRAVLRGHRDFVLAAAFRPSAKGPLRELATASTDRTIRLWDVASGANVLSLQGHLGIVSGLAFSPSIEPSSVPAAGARAGVRLASASAGDQGTDNSVRLWETEIPAATRVQRARAREAERALLGELRVLIRSDLPPATAVLESLARLDPRQDAAAVELLRFRGRTSKLAQVLGTVAAEPGPERESYERAKAWAEHALRLDPADRELKSVLATLERSTARGR